MRVLSLIEGQIVSSPARIVLQFARDAREAADLRIVNLVRGAAPGALLEAAAENDIAATALPDAGPYDLALLSKLKGVISEYRPDVVQTNSVKSHLLVSLTGRRGFGWLAFHHGYTSEDLKMRAYNLLDRFSLRKCDEVVTVCNAFAGELQRNGVAREKIRVIPNSIPGDFFAPDPAVRRAWRQRFGIGEDESVILTAGRLSPEKGHAFLIEAAARLRASGRAPKFRVLIAGAGLREAQLSKQIADRKLVGTVELIGFQPDIRPLFQMADLFVLPSLSEGSPMVLLESMMARVPVVATNAGGIPEMLAHGETALLVAPADPEALSDALLEFLTQPERARAVAEAAYRHARESFNPQLYNTRVLAAFEDVVRRRENALYQRVEVPQ